MKIVLNSVELQEVVTEALNAQGIDTSNSEFTFDGNGVEIELNAKSKPVKQKHTRKKAEEVESETTVEEFQETEPEETDEVETTSGEFEIQQDEVESDDDSDSLFD